MTFPSTPHDELWIQYSHLAEGGFGRVMRESDFLEFCKRYVPSEIREWKPGDPRVVCAAIRDKLGRIVAGARHFDKVMIEQIRRTVPDQDAFRSAEQGFIDQFGNFLTREEAMVIATKWGQVIRDDEGRQSLYSENLY